MPIAGTPKNLDNRSFLTGHPLFNGLSLFYYGGSNKNMLTQRVGSLYRDFGETANLSYVDSPINNLPGSKAIVGTDDRDSIILDIPIVPLTNDLPGVYGDFTILFWGKLLTGGTIFSLNDSAVDANNIWVNSFIGSEEPVGTTFNMFFNAKGSLGQFENGGQNAIKGVNALYCFRRQGNNFTLSVNDLPGIPNTIPDIGTITLSGLAFLGRRNLEPFDNRRGISETALLMVYKRALSNEDVEALHDNPFLLLPDPSGVIIPPENGYRKEINAYNIGNSVTDTIAPSKLKSIANDNGARYLYGRQVILGAPLELIQQNPASGFVEQPYGYPTNAFANFNWDILSLQPFDRGLTEDLAACKYFIDLLYSRLGSSNARVLVYSRWARQVGENPPGSEIYPPYDIATLWARPASNPESKAYFESLLLALRAEYPTKKIDIAPVGDALLLLDAEAKAGRVPGIATAKDLFVDGIHLGDLGQYLTGCVYYATMFKEDPAALGFAPYAGVTQAQADKIQAIAWETVDGHPYSGVDSILVVDPNPPPEPVEPFGCIPDTCGCGEMPCVEQQSGQVFDRILEIVVDGKPLAISQSAVLTFLVKDGAVTVVTCTASIAGKGLVRLRLTGTQTLPLEGLYSWSGVIVDGAVTTTLAPGEFWVRGL